MRTTKAQISLHIHAVWSAPLLFYLDSMLSLVANPEDMSHLMTKPTKWHVCPAKTQISLGILPVWSESSLSTWRKLGSLATRWVHREDSDQTGQMPRLIWVFAGCTVILLVSSCRGSNVEGPDQTADSDFPNSWFPHKRQNKIPWLFPDMNSNFPDSVIWAKKDF